MASPPTLKFSIRMSERPRACARCAALLALEVELDRALAAVGGVEIGGAQMAAVGCRHERRAPAAGVVAGALALDLDHVGAEIGENLAGPGPGQDAGQAPTHANRSADPASTILPVSWRRRRPPLSLPNNRKLGFCGPPGRRLSTWSLAKSSSEQILLDTFHDGIDLSVRRPSRTASQGRETARE